MTGPPLPAGSLLYPPWEPGQGSLTPTGPPSRRAAFRGAACSPWAFLPRPLKQQEKLSGVSGLVT